MENYRNNFFFIHTRIINEYKEQFKDISKEYDLTATEIDIITFLINNSKHENTANDIAYYRGLTKSMISRGVSSLLKKNIIISESDKDDKRRYLLSINKEKEVDKITKSIYKENQIFIDKIKKNITKEEFDIYMKVTMKMKDNVVGKENIF